MKDLISLIKETAIFRHARFSAQFPFNKDLWGKYEKQLSAAQKKIFSLVPVAIKKGGEAEIFQGALTLRSQKISNQTDNFKIVSDFLENNLKTPLDFSNRVIFEYGYDKYEAKSLLPVVLEEKKDNIGKVVLNGVRISFPDYKEPIDSIIIDLHKCPDCDDAAIIVQVMSSDTANYSLSYVKRTIKSSYDFTRVFISEKSKKNA